MARKVYTLEGLQESFPDVTFLDMYKTKCTRLKLLCSHCKCERDVTISNFITQKGSQYCKKCCTSFRPVEQGGSRTFEMVIKEGHAKFNYKFFYIQDISRTFYKARGKENNFNIVCLKHKKVFSSNIGAHLKSSFGNCPDCCYEYLCLLHRRPLEDILEQANEVHDNKYDYSLIKPEDHTNMNKKEKEYHSIICPEHGVFKQTFYVHIHDRCGCPTCGKDIGFRHKDKAYTASLKERHKTSNLYVMEFSNKDEMFFKIGISVDVKLRVRQLKNSSKLKYEIKPLVIARSDVELIPKLELKLHEVFKDFAYKPNHPFQGDGECFSSINDILDHIPREDVEIVTNLLK